MVSDQVAVVVADPPRLRLRVRVGFQKSARGADLRVKLLRARTR